MLLNLNRDNFDKIVTNNQYTVVYFWASWCGPCRNFSQIYDEVAKNNPDFVFAKIDVEQHKNLAEDFSIKSVPHLMIFKGNVMVYSESGALGNEALTSLLLQTKDIQINNLEG